MSCGRPEGAVSRYVKSSRSFRTRIASEALHVGTNLASAHRVEPPFDLRPHQIPDNRLGSDPGMVAIMPPKINFPDSAAWLANPFIRRQASIAIAGLRRCADLAEHRLSQALDRRSRKGLLPRGQHRKRISDSANSGPHFIRMKLPR